VEPATEGIAGVVTLDVSELEAPEPLVRALEALEALPEGACLQMIHRMRPELLYERAEAMGFRSDTRMDDRGQCRIYFWRAGDHEAERLARRLAGRFDPWEE